MQTSKIQTNLEEMGIKTITRLEPGWLRPQLLDGMPLEFFKGQHVLPICKEAGRFAVVTADPGNIEAIDAVLGHLAAKASSEGFDFKPSECEILICPQEEIEEAISHCYYGQADSHLEELVSGPEDKTQDGPAQYAPSKAEDLLDIADRAPAIRLAKMLLYKAVQARASDLHIEPTDQGATVRFRIDGVLHEVARLPKNQVAALLSRLKIMANLNIAERRLPQDGQTRIKIGKDVVDIRISTIPIVDGERVVLRLLDKGQGRFALSELGLDQDILATFRQLIHMPHGIILLTGPTGSGKTTTLYAVLSELDRDRQNILTVEDPVEYRIPGVGQMQVRPKIGLTFAVALRHILRQDPDVLMIGEIRDAETAKIAIQASLTGHLVLSTLHTNDAASAVTRLADMGIEHYLISSSVIACLAQRLVRVICPKCRCPDTSPGLEACIRSWPELAGGGTFFRGAGCDYCLHTGYMGRTGIFELMVVDERIRELISAGSPAQVIRQAAIVNGMKVLKAAGLAKARDGITTIEEVFRVTQDLVFIRQGG
ncbi:MAG: ATPase, T2SS/T4P/T4SS family [Sedimentisphaerales bacterium]|jgi:general secretion pathway protein E|nr:ATPase, T2SS/T4P/T4SS family [Sedimentisphaerales bacterium]